MENLCENMIDRLFGNSLESRCDTANEESLIGQYYKSVTNQKIENIEDIDEILTNVNQMFERFDLSISNFETISKKTYKYRMCCCVMPLDGYLILLLNESENEGVKKYLINYCNNITDKSIFDFDYGRMKIKTCLETWFESHTKFIKSRIEYLENIRKRIDYNITNAEKIEASKIKRREKAKEKNYCGCGGCYTRCHKSHHQNTKFHLDWIKEGCPVRTRLETEPEPESEPEPEPEPEQSAENIQYEIEEDSNEIECVDIISDISSVTESTSSKMSKEEYLSTIINCECGASHRRSNTSNHRQTNQHKSYVNNNQKSESVDKKENSSVITCDCGGKYTKSNKATHCKSKLHTTWLLFQQQLATTK